MSQWDWKGKKHWISIPYAILLPYITNTVLGLVASEIKLDGVMLHHPLY